MIKIIIKRKRVTLEFCDLRIKPLFRPQWVGRLKADLDPISVRRRKTIFWPQEGDVSHEQAYPRLSEGSP